MTLLQKKKIGGK